MKSSKQSKLYLLLLLISICHIGCEEEHRRPAEIYIPDGYVGWVRIEYGVKDAPKLQTDFLGPLEYQRFPPSGLLQTSSELRDGAASAHHYYYSGDETKPLSDDMINGGIISWCVRKPDGSRLEREFITYFVGSKAEYEKHKDELGRFRKSDCQYIINSLDDLPKVGNISNKAS